VNVTCPPVGRPSWSVRTSRFRTPPVCADRRPPSPFPLPVPVFPAFRFASLTQADASPRLKYWSPYGVPGVMPGVMPGVETAARR